MNHYVSIALFLTISCCIVSAQAADTESTDVSASGDLITAKHRYAMGDNDTKSDANALCFLEAKKKAVEYAGTFVESITMISQTDKVRSGRTDIKTIAASLISTEMVSSKSFFTNDKMFVDCVVNARVDRSQLKAQVDKIAADPGVLKQVEDQQSRLKSLEGEVKRLQGQLQSAPRQEAIALRQERSAVFQEIDALQKKKLEIVTVIESKGKDAQRLIVKNMTMTEVISLMGEPRARRWRDVPWVSDGTWNYGSTWVHFNEAKLVECVSGSDHYRCP
jgi:hypothetical protein